MISNPLITYHYYLLIYVNGCYWGGGYSAYIWYAYFHPKNWNLGLLVYTYPFFMVTEVAEFVLQRSVELERFLVNSESFRIKLSYEFVDDNGQHMNR